MWVCEDCGLRPQTPKDRRIEKNCELEALRMM